MYASALSDRKHIAFAKEWNALAYCCDDKKIKPKLSKQLKFIGSIQTVFFRHEIAYSKRKGKNYKNEMNPWNFVWNIDEITAMNFFFL